MEYPSKLTILAPQFRVAVDDNKRAFSNRLVFLPAFAVLHAVRDDKGHIAFHERVELDPTGNRSIDLLIQIASELDADATLGGWRLDRQVASLNRLPRDSERECEGKAPLMRFGLALAHRPIDVAWFDREGGLPTLVAAAARHGLAAQWRDQRSMNPAIVRQRLSARARSVWATIADKLLEQGEARRKAFACFDQFNSKASWMK
ncbi:MAG: hypothetical protein WKF52_05565 [Sphingomicrobium sp.]